MVVDALVSADRNSIEGMRRVLWLPELDSNQRQFD
jgi:hypothetical protein